jgi:DNA mismatch endonuclease, patch repair protein
LISVHLCATIRDGDNRLDIQSHGNHIAADGCWMIRRRRHDPLTPEQRRHTMRSVHSEDTGPERKVRSVIHQMGYRFRLHRRDLPGNPDIVFPGLRKIIFVHGCFWHGHSCLYGVKTPKTNREYWVPKLEGNVQRDRRNKRLLKKLGWSVLVIWECQITNISRLRKKLDLFLGG